MFYVNDEPDGKFIYTETIKLYSIVTPPGFSLISATDTSNESPATR